MGRNLTSLYISSSFQFLTQVSGSELQDGLGNKITGSLEITSSKADNATSASFASTSVSSSYSTTALSASYAATALSASHAINADTAITASYSLTTAPISTIYETVVAGENLTKTDPVYLSGSSGANPIAYKADAGNAAKMPVAYIMNETVNSGQTGQAIALGLIEGIDLTGYTAGQEVYVAVGGGWTATRPTGSAIIQPLGLVTKGGNGGKGIVLNPGPVTLPNLTSGYTWVGDSNSVPQATATSSLSVASAVSSSYATTAASATTATSASYATNALSSSYALTASYAANAGTTVDTGSLLTTASAAGNVLTFTKGDASTFNVTVATGSIPSTGSLLVTASSTNDTITYTKGDGTTFTNVINNVTQSISASFATNATSASYADSALSSSYVITASFALNAAGGAQVLKTTGSANILFEDSASWGGGFEPSYSPNNVILLGENAQYSGSGYAAVMLGGIDNKAQTQGGIMSSGSVMLGGINNTWIGNGFGSFMIGGESNTMYRPYGFGQRYGGIIGGAGNNTQYADGPDGGFVIITGQNNTGNGYWGGIFGGTSNTYTGQYGFMAGGASNTLTHDRSVILGGSTITSSANDTVFVPDLLATGSVQINQQLISGRNNIITSNGYFNSNAIIASYTSSISASGDTGTGSVVLGGSNNRILGNGGVISAIGQSIIGGTNNTLSSNSDMASIAFSSDSTLTAGPGRNSTIVSSISSTNTGDTGCHIFAGRSSQIDSGDNLLILGGRSTRIYGSNDGNTVLVGGNTLRVGFSDFSGFTNNGDSIGLGGNLNQVNGHQSAIVGGKSNRIASNTNSSIGIAIIGGASNTVYSATGAVASGSVIIGGKNHYINVNDSVILGGSNISASVANTVYVPNLDVSGSLYDSLNSTGSSGQVLSSNANGQLEWIAAGGGGSIDTGSFATTGSNTFIGNQIVSGSFEVTSGITGSLLGTAATASYVVTAQTASYVTTAQTASYYDFSAVTQNAVFSGSVRGDVSDLSISSNTASLDLSTGNFFTVQLVSGSNTYINPSNIQPGQTVNIRVNTTGSGTVSFPTSVKQVSGSAYVPTTATGVDIITLISFDSTNLYLSNVKNLI